MKIRWNTSVSAPCAGEIVQVYRNGKPTGNTILVQSDWDYPAVARNFGWDMTDVLSSDNLNCAHESTDGTVACRGCGLTATDFIGAAYDWLRAHHGATAEDPGYFS